VSRRQLFGLGLTHWQIAAEVRAGRWAQHLRQTIAVHTGELGELALWWSAIFEVGSGAALDGASALILAMCVQQRIVAVPELTEAFASIRRHRRRSFIKTILADLSNGVHSIGELEFARLCREFGLPEPDRQARRVGPNGVIYLDSEWSADEVIVEIEGFTTSNLARPLLTRAGRTS
jgi:hypothetical protein